MSLSDSLTDVYYEALLDVGLPSTSYLNESYCPHYIRIVFETEHFPVVFKLLAVFLNRAWFIF